MIKLPAQTGGAFTIEKSVIAAGGGTSAGSVFTIESVIGQSTTGNAQGGQFTIFGGLITPPNLAPTAGTVTIGGRVRTEDGKGIRNVSVTLTAANGEIRTVVSGASGAFRFEDVPVGETYIITVVAKRFVFANPTQIIGVLEQIDDLDFVGSRFW